MNEGGKGGFGGGGGADGADGGFGGGADFPAGGGGAGMGGAIFVENGGALIMRGTIKVTGNAARSDEASAFGAGLFLDGTGILTFSPGKGQTDHVGNAIDDELGVEESGYTPFPEDYSNGQYILNKTGKGTLILSANNAYSSGTNVKAGTLIVDGSIIHSSTTVMSGATLGGNGSTGDVTVLAGGILSPGRGAGILHTRNVTLDAHAHFAVQLGGANPGQHGYDQVDAAGTVSLAGAELDLSLIGAFHPKSHETFVIIEGNGPIEGRFAGLTEGAHFVADGSIFSIGYHGGLGNEVVLTDHGDSAAPALHQVNAAAHGDLWAV
jgi:autotransporter-associated beta strand protein